MPESESLLPASLTPASGAIPGEGASAATTVTAPSTGVPALEIRGLVRRFGEKVAVDNLSLVVPSGSFYGLVGPNGAGKTTTLSMATGLLRPDAGEISIHGVDVWHNLLQAKLSLIHI